MIDLVYSIWNNKVKIAGGYVGLWIVSPKTAEILTRIAYGWTTEQFRTGY